MRDSVRVPSREVPGPGEASDQQRTPRQRSGRSFTVPGRTTAPQPVTKTPVSTTTPKARESHPFTLVVIDRVVSVATAILRGNGTVKPTHKYYRALLATLDEFPSTLPVEELTHVLANLAHLEKQQSSGPELAIQRPFMHAVLHCLTDTHIKSTPVHTWHHYIEQIGQENDTAQVIAQLLEKLAPIQDPTLQTYREQLSERVGPAKLAAYSIPTWKENGDSLSSVTTYLTDALADSPISEAYFDMLYARFLATEDTVMLRQSITTVLDHTEALGANLLTHLRSKLGIVNLDRYPLTQLHLLAALIARDKATIERLHRRDVQLILVDANGDYNGELLSIYDRYVQKSGSTIMLEVSRPSDFYRHLLFLDDYDIHPSTIVISAHGTPQLLHFGQDKDSFNLAVLAQQNQEDAHQVTLSQSSLERIARQFMVAGKVRSINGKRQKKIIIASCSGEEQFAEALPALVIPSEQTAPKGRSIDVSFQDAPEKNTSKSTAEKQPNHSIVLTSDQTSETVLQYDWIPGSETQKSTY